MRLSIFNSDIPYSSPWWKMWLLVLLLTGSLLGGVELYWRIGGHLPGVKDDKPLWAYYRQRASSADTQTVALLGASEIQTGFSLETFSKSFPDYQVNQLGISGTGPLPALRDLANDENFRGVIICAINPKTLADKDPRNLQNSFVHYYHTQTTLNSRLNRRWGARLENSLVLLSDRLSLQSCLHAWQGYHAFPGPIERYMTDERELRIDFWKMAPHRLSDLHARRLDYFAKNYPPGIYKPAPWLETALRIEPEIEKIQRRGGQVVWVRFPLDAQADALIEKSTPHAEFWDRFVTQTKAITIDCHTLPELATFSAPDTTHLDYRDAPRFTAALLKQLVRKGVLPPSKILDTMEEKPYPPPLK